MIRSCGGPAGRRWCRSVAGLLGLSLLASLLTSCSATPQLGFRLAPDGRHVEVLLNRCKGSRMHVISATEEVDPATHSGSDWVTGGK